MYDEDNKLISSVAAALLSACISFGSMSCMITGLGLKASPGVLLYLCLFFGAVAAGCLWLPRGGWVMVGCLAAGLLLMSYAGLLTEQTKSMCLHILTFYRNAYGILIPQWLSDAHGDSHLLPLLAMAMGGTALTVWTVMRRKPCIFAVVGALLPAASCIVVTDTVPRPWSLFFLLAGIAILLLSQPVRRRSSDDGNRLTGYLVIPVAAAMLLLSVCIPREGYQTPPLLAELTEKLDQLAAELPYLTYTESGNLIFASKNKLGEKVDLAASGPRKYQGNTVMEVTAGDSRKLYLRGRSYTTYDGKSWSALMRDVTLSPLHTTLIQNTTEVTVSTRSREGYYYLPCYPNSRAPLENGMLKNQNFEKEYTFLCTQLNPDVRFHNSYQSYLGLSGTEETLILPKDTKLRAQWLLQDQDILDADAAIIIQRIEDYVRSSARYSLSTPKMPEEETDFAFWFLERSDTGYCVHFATAATVLLRAAGIPARYVEGYTVNVTAGETTEVKDRMAHAWVEYYVPNVGWLIMDPTPAEAQTPPSTPTQSTQPTLPTTVPTASTAPVPGEKNTESAPKWLTATLWSVLGLGLSVVLLFTQWQLRRQRKLRRMRLGSPNRQALARYREACRLAKLSKLALPQALTALAEKAKYSQHTLTPAELHQFNAFLAQCGQALRKQPWYRRICTRFLFAAY